MSKTSITFLSLGPGDPELLTLKAVRTLREADIIMVPATRTDDGQLKSRATDIISEWCDHNRLTFYELPMLNDRQAVSVVYDRMFEDIVRCHAEGRRVAVAVEGDVSIYASVHYVMDRLTEAGLAVEQLAGIPSFIAAAADAGLSLVSQRQRLTILPGDADTDTLSHLLQQGHVVVVMKLSRCQQAVKDFLHDHPDTRCHYLENIGTAEAFHATEREVILSRKMPYFSLCILYPS